MYILRVNSTEAVATTPLSQGFHKINTLDIKDLISLICPTFHSFIQNAAKRNASSGISISI